ncbi:ATP-binding protein, partial [Pseudomonas amygdali]|uniref:ATP-binding protein n=1 Tax=Pseudomonas amygdali TaxID=47877 RepID=UPI0018C27F69
VRTPTIRACSHKDQWVTCKREQTLGLGLYIASEIALAHGGTLEVCSTQEQGTAFTFRMPLKSA